MKYFFQNFVAGAERLEFILSVCLLVFVSCKNYWLLDFNKILWSGLFVPLFKYRTLFCFNTFYFREQSSGKLQSSAFYGPRYKHQNLVIFMEAKQYTYGYSGHSNTHTANISIFWLKSFDYTHHPLILFLYLWWRSLRCLNFKCLCLTVSRRGHKL